MSNEYNDDKLRDRDSNQFRLSRTNPSQPTHLQYGLVVGSRYQTLPQSDQISEESVTVIERHVGNARVHVGSGRDLEVTAQQGWSIRRTESKLQVNRPKRFPIGECEN